MDALSANQPVAGAVIDAHQHFWHYHPERHGWITDEMAAIRRDFLPGDLEPVFAASQVTGCVAVQADQTYTENDFLLGLAAANRFILGVVGWVDFSAADLPERLAYYAGLPLLKGFRHILQGEEPGYLLQPAFTAMIAQLQAFDFTYDILVYPQHLPAVLQLVKKFPDQQFVVDHIAKPRMRQGFDEEWLRDMTALSAFGNVCCKVSGMVTETNMRTWTPATFTPYLDRITELFGMSRLMYGSDWPVCLAAGTYPSVFNIVKDYYRTFSAGEQNQFFGGNAAGFYHLK